MNNKEETELLHLDEMNNYEYLNDEGKDRYIELLLKERKVTQ